MSDSPTMLTRLRYRSSSVVAKFEIQSLVERIGLDVANACLQVKAGDTLNIDTCKK